MENKEYRKKPIVIQAYQAEKDGEIKTLEGVMKYHKGDYIVTGIKGEQYACREDIFKETYEPLERIPAETKEKFTHELPKELKEYYTKSSGWWGEMVDKMTPDERSN